MMSLGANRGSNILLDLSFKELPIKYFFIHSLKVLRKNWAPTILHIFTQCSYKKQDFMSLPTQNT